MVVNGTGFPTIEQVQDQLGSVQARPAAPAVNAQGFSFGQVLDQVTQEHTPLKFSKHAMNRLSSRGIEMTQDQFERLNEGKLRAGQKGIKESLIMVDDFKFIVNVPNNTVVTALNGEESDGKIFTNIDGAVII